MPPTVAKQDDGAKGVFLFLEDFSDLERGFLGFWVLMGVTPGKLN